MPESTIDLDRLKCPLTHQIMNEPIVAADGFFYEKEAWEEYVDTIKTSWLNSPMTGKPIGVDYTVSISYQCLIKETLEKNPELQEMQYKILTSISFNILLHIIATNNHSVFTEYKNYNLTWKIDDDLYFLDWLSEHVDKETAIHIIINSTKTNCSYRARLLTVINGCTKFININNVDLIIELVKKNKKKLLDNSSFKKRLILLNSSKLLKYIDQYIDQEDVYDLLEKNKFKIAVDILNNNAKRWTRLYQKTANDLVIGCLDDKQLKTIAKFKKDEFVKYARSKKIVVGDKIRTIVFTYSSLDIVKLLLDCEINWDLSNNNPERWRLIHYACFNNEYPEVPEYMLSISTKQELENRAKGGVEPYHIIMEYNAHLLGKLADKLADTNLLKRSNSKKGIPKHKISNRY